MSRDWVYWTFVALALGFALEGARIEEEIRERIPNLFTLSQAEGFPLYAVVEVHPVWNWRVV